jgi:predicted GNAT family N-acyltransferase
VSKKIESWRKMIFLKDYKNNELLRNSFNQLAFNTFGIQFETWYQHGYWTEKYIPYSFIDNGRVVANASVNLITLVIHGELIRAVQIGTVMTHPDYRNRGLSRRLMEMVLEDYKEVDLVYLFANQSVLDFYPKFGFEALEEVQFSMEYSHGAMERAGIRKLDGGNEEDLRFIFELAANRKPVSKIVGASGTEELLMFYCLMVFPQDLYYLEEEQALVIYQMEENVLHVYDVVSSKEIDELEILRKIAEPNVNKIIFHYHLDNREVPSIEEPYQSSNTLFVKKLTEVDLPEGFKHPITSQA